MIFGMFGRSRKRSESLDYVEGDDDLHYGADSAGLADHIERFFGSLFHVATLCASPFFKVGSVLVNLGVKLRWRILGQSRLVAIPDSDPDEVVSNGIIQRLSGRVQDLGFWFFEKLAQVAEGFEIAFDFIFIAIPRMFSGRKSDSVNVQKELQKDLTQPEPDRRNVADLVELPVSIAADVGERTVVATARTIGTVSERVAPKRLIWTIYGLFDAVIAFPMSLYDFCLEWWFTRDFRKLIFAVPALLLILPLGAAGILSLRNTKPKRIRHYSAALREALDSETSEATGLLRSKLQQLGYRDLERLEFDEILAFAEGGDIGQAFQRMQKLAPLDGTQPGLLDAHQWIGMVLLDRKVTVPDVVDRLERHAQAILRVEPENPLALRMVAETHLARSEFDLAIEKMELVRKQFPDVVYVLGTLYNDRGDTVRAGKNARAAIRLHEAAESTDDVEVKARLTVLGHLQLATCYEIVGDTAKCLGTLRRAIKRYPDDSALTEALQQQLNSAVASLQANGLASKSPSTVQLISELAPDHEQLARMLARGLYLSDATTQRYVQQLLQADAVSPKVFEMVGSTCMIRKEYRRAEKYLVKTCELRDSSPSAWNNLAWIWANVNPLHPKKALAAANRAIELQRDPRFYETRGQIHLRFRHWTEAVEDLELALNGEVPNANDAHRGLARAYHELGNRVLSKAHLQQLASGDDVRVH